MAEHSETRVEMALRRALAAEAATFALRLDGEAVLARRRPSRFARSRSLPVVAAGLVAAVLIVGVVLPLTRSATGPATEPAGVLDGLPSFERLKEAYLLGVEAWRGEGPGAAADASLTIADPVTRGVPLGIMAGCTGGPLEVRLESPERSSRLGSVECTAGVSLFGVPPALTSGAVDTALRLRVPAGTAWRAVLVTQETGELVSAGTDAQPGLPTFADLEALIGGQRTTIARGSGSADGQPLTVRVPGITWTEELTFAIACSDKAVEVWAATGPSISDEQGAVLAECSFGPVSFSLPPGPVSEGVTELHVRTQPGTRWNLVVRTAPPVTP